MLSCLLISKNIFYSVKKKINDHSKVVLLLLIIFVIYVLCLSCFLVCWSPAGNGVTSWLSLCGVLLRFVTFPCYVLGPVWYLIVLIPDLCLFTYFTYTSDHFISNDHLCKILYLLNFCTSDKMVLLNITTYAIVV